MKKKVNQILCKSKNVGCLVLKGALDNLSNLLEDFFLYSFVFTHLFREFFLQHLTFTEESGGA